MLFYVLKVYYNDKVFKNLFIAGYLNLNFFFFLAMPAACEISQVRDQALTIAATQATAVTMLDP